MKILGELSTVDETFMISDMNFMVSEKLCNNGVTYDKQDFLYPFFSTRIWPKISKLSV